MKTEALMKRVLIAYDGSESADEALDDLRYAGLPGDLDVKVLTVADVWLPADSHKLDPVYPDLEAKAVRRARASARHALKDAEEISTAGAADLRGMFPKWRIDAVAVADSPAWAILRTARQWHADLVVVGSHGRSALQKLFLGSVAQKVAAETHCSVRVSRPRPDHARDQFRVLIAVDGSSDAEAAIRAVLDRHWRFNAEFKLVTVIDHRLQSAVAWPGTFADSWVVQHDKESREWACRMIEQQAKRLAEAGLKVETHIYDGDPKENLLKAAKDLEIDCIFVGAHGLHHADKLSLGTVASAVTARAHCSVEIVRPG